tara:strand:- start:843 stop:1094 length:252 start_codon:yes stop_codon:yes gene_type:complete
MVKGIWIFILATFTLACMTVWVLTGALLLDAWSVGFNIQPLEIMLDSLFVVCSIFVACLPYQIYKAMQFDLLRRKNAKFKSTI